MVSLKVEMLDCEKMEILKVKSFELRGAIWSFKLNIVIYAVPTIEFLLRS